MTNLEEETRLHLNGAILLKALTDKQIQQYLASVKLAELWQVLQQDAEILELMRTPLFLSVLGFIFLYEEFDIQKWQNLTSTKARFRCLFDAYWQAAMKRELVSRHLLLRGIKSLSYRKRKPPSMKLTRYWLVFLAQHLQQESQTEFLIEKIQASWLSTGKQRSMYILIAGLIVVLIAGLLSLLCGEQAGKPVLGLISEMLVTSLIFGLAAYLFSERELKGKIELVEILNLSFRKAGVGPIFVLTIGLIHGLTSRGGLASLPNFVLMSVLIGGVHASEIDIKRNPNQGIQKSVINALMVALISGLISGLIGRPNSTVICISWLIFGGVTCIQHLALRLVFFQNGYIPWNYARFLNYATERMFLQRVGGRYRFIHKLLQDHFAQMPLDASRL